MSFIGKLKENYSVHPVATVSTVIGIITGVIGIIAAIHSSAQWAGQFIVSPEQLQQQLKESEDRITAKFHDEAVTIREVYIADLIEQKAKVNELILKATTTGQIKYYTIQIDALNKKIDKLRGTVQ